MDLNVNSAPAAGMAAEFLAETAWRHMFESLDSFKSEGVRGQQTADWLAQTLAGELAGHMDASVGGPHGS